MPLHKGTAFGNLWYKSKLMERRAPTQGHGIRESLVQINQNLSAAVPLHKGTALGNLWYKSKLMGRRAPTKTPAIFGGW